MLDLEINQVAKKPKYLQLADQIIAQIEHNNLTLNEKLPSVNNLSETLNISRETVFKALNLLSERGIVYSENRKGYFVSKTDVNTELRICLILDKFTTFKDKLYHAFFETIRDRGEVDVFFHHHNYGLLENLIKENLSNYTHFAIVTFFKQDVKPLLNLIPAEKRIILDCKEFGLKGDYTMIFQNFAEDIYHSLNKAHHHLKKYDKLVLVASDSLYHTDQVREGFCRYCSKHNLRCELIQELTPSDFTNATVYISISADERDITNIIKLAHQNNYKIGKDIGIISYNDTPIKEVLEGGITVITTDFKSMGEKAAKMILNNEQKILKNPTKLIMRNSL